MTSGLWNRDSQLEMLGILEFASVSKRGSINVTHGGFQFTGGRGVSGSGMGIGRARVGADNKVLTGDDILASGCDDWQKMMWPNTQSIKGLNWVSQWNPSTMVIIKLQLACA